MRGCLARLLCWRVDTDVEQEEAMILRAAGKDRAVLGSDGRKARWFREELQLLAKAVTHCLQFARVVD